MNREERLRKAVQRGKYAPLYRYLRTRRGTAWRVSFNELERLLGFTLPESARVHRPWWSNQRNGGGHGHTLAWQLAGWKTRTVDLELETLVFEPAGAVGDPALPAGAASRSGARPADLDTVFPPHDPGPWPAGASLRREDLYGDRGQ